MYKRILPRGQVVKNVASQSLEVKKLVYLYLLHYADKYVTNAMPCVHHPLNHHHSTLTMACMLCM